MYLSIYLYIYISVCVCANVRVCVCVCDREIEIVWKDSIYVFNQSSRGRNGAAMCPPAHRRLGRAGRVWRGAQEEPRPRNPKGTITWRIGATGREQCLAGGGRAWEDRMKLTRAMTRAEGARVATLVMVGAVGGRRPTGMCPMTCTFCRAAGPRAASGDPAKGRFSRGFIGLFPSGARSAPAARGTGAEGLDRPWFEP